MNGGSDVDVLLDLIDEIEEEALVLQDDLHIILRGLSDINFQFQQKELLRKKTPQEIWFDRLKSIQSRGPDYSHIAEANTIQFSDIIYVPDIYDLVGNLDEKSIIDSVEFDVFKYKDANDYESLIFYIIFMYQKLNLLKDCHIPAVRLYRFIKSVFFRYRNVPFHNLYHGFNVTQTLYYFLEGLGCKTIFCSEELLVMMLAALCHDIDHPGLNNRFHKLVKTKLCEQFNSASILEHHHYSQAAEILQRDECNIIFHYDTDDSFVFNSLIKKAILATDLALHRVTMDEIDLRSESVYNLVHGITELENCDDEDITLAMISLIKCADISNEIRERTISSRWAELVNAEFKLQANIEKEHDLSPFIPLEALENVAQEQVNFIEKLCLPLYEKVTAMFPSLEICIDQLEANAEEWKDISLGTNRNPTQGTNTNTGWENQQRKGDLKEILNEEVGDLRRSSSLSVPGQDRRPRKSMSKKRREASKQTTP